SPPSRGRYAILYRDSDGRLRSRAVAGSLEDAKTTRADIISKLGKGERVAPTRLTFEGWAEEWLASLDKRPRTIRTATRSTGISSPGSVAGSSARSPPMTSPVSSPRCAKLGTPGGRSPAA